MNKPVEYYEALAFALSYIVVIVFALAYVASDIISSYRKKRKGAKNEPI